MSLQALLDLSSRKNIKVGVSEERLQPVIPVLREYISFWREYPDLFVDFLQTGGDPNKKKRFDFFFYQRVFIRAAMRHRKMYAVFPRGYSKSFLCVLTQMVRCILFPGAKLYSAAGGKEQSAGILSEKIEEICTLIPAFNREIRRGRGIGNSTVGKDYCKYVFKNDSYIDNMTASERSRGKRRQGGIFEECVSIDKNILQQVLIPIANISRQCLDGTKQKDEVLNQSELYITTAGYRSDFAYEKLIQLLVEMVINPKEVFIMGGTYRIPVIAGLYDQNIIANLKRDDTYNQAAFEREYESKWSGTVEDAFFNGEHFDRNRILQKPEYEASKRSSKQAFYIISADIARSPRGCQTAAVVIKCTPQPQGPMIKSIVNIVTWTGEHFEEQAIALKKLFYQYNAKRLIIDANGLGYGLVDWMVKPQNNPEDNVELPDFGVYNDDNNEFKKFRTENTEEDAMYLVKANVPLNSEAYVGLQSDLASGKIKFLIEERVARTKLLSMQRGKAMTPEQRIEYLMPYAITDILKEELLNLREENQGINVILKQVTRSIGKDKVSALAYGIYYIKKEEEQRKKKKKFNAGDYLFLN